MNAANSTTDRPITSAPTPTTDHVRHRRPGRRHTRTALAVSSVAALLFVGAGGLVQAHVVGKIAHPVSALSPAVRIGNATPPAVNPPAVNPPAVNPPGVNPPAVNPPVSPPAVNPPSATGFPTAATTGVPAGTTLRASGSITVNAAGTVLDGLDITGTVIINASNVTVRRSRITGSDFALIRVKEGVTGVRIEDVEIDGRGRIGEANSMGVYGPATVERANVHGVENGLTPFSGSVLRGNYIHDLAAPGSPHYDGIQIDGGVRDVVIDNNTVDMNEHDQTSAVMIDNYFGPINNIAVTNNRLLGGGYTVYSDGQFSGGSITGVSFVNNRLGRGYWGYASFNGNSPVWTGNVDDITGVAVR